MGNEIGDCGAKRIALALEKNATVKMIGLRSVLWMQCVWNAVQDGAVNKIGDGGADRIVRALEKNTTITKIYLESGQWMHGCVEQLR